MYTYYDILLVTEDAYGHNGVRQLHTATSPEEADHVATWLKHYTELERGEFIAVVPALIQA